MGHIPIWSHEVVLKPEAVSASRARHFVRRNLAEHQLWYLADDVGLAVSELATNAAIHARTPFTVSLQDGAESVLLTVRDGAPELPHRVNTNVMDTHGRGLAIVELLSRDWGVTTAPDASKSVWASFATRTGREAPSFW
jgi:anti-sigma regulatory factor (Ser/Thr protein kinase)